MINMPKYCFTSGFKAAKKKFITIHEENKNTRDETHSAC